MKSGPRPEATLKGRGAHLWDEQPDGSLDIVIGEPDSGHLFGFVRCKSGLQQVTQLRPHESDGQRVRESVYNWCCGCTTPIVSSNTGYMDVRRRHKGRGTNDA